MWLYEWYGLKLNVVVKEGRCWRGIFSEEKIKASLLYPITEEIQTNAGIHNNDVQNM